MKLTPLITCLCIATSLSTNAATVVFDLGGLTSPTGAAVGDTRQFASTTTGGELTITYTVEIFNMESPVSIANDFQFDNLFRRPGSGGQLPATGGNMIAGEGLRITLDSIITNSGWTLNSLTKSNTVAVGGDSRNGSEQATFTVNGGTSFDLGVSPASGNITLTDSRFTAFDAVGDSLLFETTAGNTGKLNLKALAFTADVTAVPEPSSTALLGLGGFALILRRRR